MDRLTAFGLFAVTAMLVTYWLEDRSRWFVLAFAVACWLGSAYGFLQGALAVRDRRADLGRGGTRRWAKMERGAALDAPKALIEECFRRKASAMNLLAFEGIPRIRRPAPPRAG